MRMDMGRYPEFAPKVNWRFNTEVQIKALQCFA